MSKPKAWRAEWSLFLDEDKRRKYNSTCLRCANDCKQSFRATLVSCPRYSSKRREDDFKL
ncbi:MAG: hypothetical protein MSA52_04210 [Oscillospiraceae bacterium]|nr:hypothetical protein [Oscillospiraceae bacterium]